MRTLYIIGNGFDLFHNLTTSYSDFHKFVTTNIEDLENLFEEYFKIKTGNEKLWTDFEADLGTFDYRLFFRDICHIDYTSEDFRPSFTYSLEDDIAEQADELIQKIRIAFRDWLKNVDLESVKPKINLKKDAFFLTFNYTLCLEKVYSIEIDRVFHIHGVVDSDYNSIILGHGSHLEEMPEIDKSGDNNRTPFSDSENAAKYPFYALQKPVADIIEEHHGCFKKIYNINKVVVLGHSLNRIDLPYFKEIIRHTKNINWEVSYYHEQQKESHSQILEDIGVSKENITMFQFADKANLP